MASKSEQAVLLRSMMLAAIRRKLQPCKRAYYVCRGAGVPGSPPPAEHLQSQLQQVRPPPPAIDVAVKGLVRTMVAGGKSAPGVLLRAGAPGKD